MMRVSAAVSSDATQNTTQHDDFPFVDQLCLVTVVVAILYYFLSLFNAVVDDY
jgi:hypothetical protein